MRPIDNNPERVAAHGNGSDTRPQPRWGCETLPTFTQGSSSLATLGFVAESLWDSFQKSLPGSWAGFLESSFVVPTLSSPHCPPHVVFPTLSSAHCLRRSKPCRSHRHRLRIRQSAEDKVPRA